jgi:hypothetical protein
VAGRRMQGEAGRGTGRAALAPVSVRSVRAARKRVRQRHSPVHASAEAGALDDVAAYAEVPT